MRTRQPITTIFLLSFCVIFLLLPSGCNLPTATSPGFTQKSGLVQGYVPDQSQNEVPRYAMSSAQIEWLYRYGYPDRFIVSFIDETNADGVSRAARHESWYYDSAGYEIVFRDGAALTEHTAGEPVRQEGLGQTIFSPDRFTDGMTLDDLIMAVGMDSFYIDHLEHPLLPDGQVVYFKGLMAGINAGRLVFVETLPFGAAGDPVNHPKIEGEQEILPGESFLGAARGSTIIYYGITDQGTYDLFAMNEDGENIRALTTNPANDYYPNCSPDGQWIAFVSDRNGNEEIFRVKLDGSELTQLTHTGSKFKDSIYWLPDEKLLFWDGSENESRWYTLDLQTLAMESVSDDFAYQHAYIPLKSPTDGAELDIFWDDEAKQIKISITDEQGTRTIPPSTSASNTNPRWSPDGTSILFASDREGGDYDLYRMNRAGEVIQTLTASDRNELAGCWVK